MYFLFKGPVWITNVGCSNDDEILEDCYFDGWGNYCGHSEDVGVICQPGELAIAYVSISHQRRYIPHFLILRIQSLFLSDNIPPVRDVTVTSKGPSSISIRWTVSCRSGLIRSVTS